MTSKEFEKYLESIGGLISGYKINQPPITSNICECGDGWLEMIKNLIDELISEGWDKKINQIKEKFGGLRFYTGGLTDKGWAIIRKYEELSHHTCEICGKQDETVSTRGGGWIRTLCDEHSEGRPPAKWLFNDEEITI